MNQIVKVNISLVFIHKSSGNAHPEYCGQPQNVSQTPIGPQNVSQTPIGLQNVSQAPIGPQNVSQAPIGPQNVSQTPIGPKNVSQTPIGPNDPMCRSHDYYGLSLILLYVIFSKICHFLAKMRIRVRVLHT